jgi:hypothetical protein
MAPSVPCIAGLADLRDYGLSDHARLELGMWLDLSNVKA